MPRFKTSLLGMAASVALGSTALFAVDIANATDLLRGGVYSMSNARGGNAVVAFERRPDGTLVRVGSFATGGRGSGSFEDTSNGLVLGSARGETSPNNLIDDNVLLFATNAGSNTISVFSVRSEGLQLVEREPSLGPKPVSVTVNDGLLYVLNSGEQTDDLFDADGGVITNCTTGTRPTVQGFRVDPSGQLTPIADSKRLLSGVQFSGCAQVSFTPDGKFLVVTEREISSERPGQIVTEDDGANAIDVAQPTDGARNEAFDDGVIDEGVIVTFAVNADGTLDQRTIVDATGQGPFGFTFRKDGILLTSEQFDGPDGPGRGAAASYAVLEDGSLEPRSGSVDNGGTDSCWFVVTDDGQFGFVTSFFGDGRLSSYTIGEDGGLTLLEADAAGDLGLGASDLALSRDSNYLYQLNSFEGTINTFRVAHEGGLRRIQTVQAHEPSEMGGRLGLAAF